MPGEHSPRSCSDISVRRLELKHICEQIGGQVAGHDHRWRVSDMAEMTEPMCSATGSEAAFGHRPVQSDARDAHEVRSRLVADTPMPPTDPPIYRFYDSSWSRPAVEVGAYRGVRLNEHRCRPSRFLLARGVCNPTSEGDRVRSG